MNPRIKRLLSLLLALTMVFSLVTPVSATAASTTAASGKTVAIEVGETVKLNASGWLNKTTWTSSNTAIATVSTDGTVTGIAPGTATITATSKSIFSFWGSTKTTTYTVIVTEAAPQEPTVPEVTEPEEEGLTVVAGETLQLTVNANGGTTTWASSDPSVAVVDENGLVTGVSEGTVTITATITKKTGGFFWFFGWGDKTTTTTTQFQVTVLPGEEQPTEPPVATYTVTFESNGGSEVDAQTIEEGQTATEPEAPTMEGYTFAGWYSDAELTTAYDFSSPVTGDITLYAAWEENATYYTVAFESNGGSAVIAQTIEEGQTATEPEAPTMEGYTFAGWYSDAELTTAYDFDTPVTEDITLYADWVENAFEDDREEYYVTFLSNDGSDVAYDTETVAPGDVVAAPADPTREGYTFGGWYLDEQGIEPFDFASAITYDLVLFAKWVPADAEEDCVHASSSGGGTIYSITDLKVEDSEVITTINANGSAVLHVEFLSQEGGELLAEYGVQIPEYCENTDISIPLDRELPDNFLARATLVDFSGEELCSYTSIRYTAEYEAFENQTAEDLEAQGEDVIRFSELDSSTNYGALAEGVVQIPYDGVHNLVSMEMIEDEDSTMDDIQWSEIYTIANPSDEFLGLAVGTIVLIYGEDNSSNYMFKIGAVAIDEDGNAVVIPDVDVALSDFYKVLKVDMSILVEEEENEPEEQLHFMSNKIGQELSTCAEIIDVSVSPSVSLGGEIEWTPKEHVKVTGALTGTGTVEIEMKYDAKLFKDDYFECSVITDLELKVEIDVALTVDNEDSSDNLGAQIMKKIDAEYKLPNVTVPTPITGLSAFFKVTIPCQWELNAGLNFTFTSETRSGFMYDTNNGKREVDEKTRTVDFGVKGDASLKFGPKISLGLKYLGSVVEASVNVWAGVKVEGTAYLGAEFTDGPEKHACALCIDGTIRWFVDVTAKLKFCIIEDVLEATPINATLFSLEGWINILKRYPGEFYLSVLNSSDSKFGGHLHFGGGSCPNKQYRVDIKSEDANGNETTGINASIAKNNGTKVKSGTTAFALYLYDGVYSASATINRSAVKKSFVVSGNPTTVTLSPSAADGKLNGKILNADTNEPVVGASIVISQGDLSFSTCTSNSAGSYTANLPAGTYQVQISKEGYVTFTTFATVTEGQTAYLETTMMVESDRQSMGGLSGRITNAVDNSPISGATLKIRKGWNNTDQGDVLETLTTDSNGNYSYNTFSIFGVTVGLQAGNYTITATKNGYVTTSFNVVVVAGETKGGQNATMSPTMTNQEYRIVLTWGATPNDLDSHFNGLTTDGYRDHIYYSNKVGYSGNLDVDDTSSYGPETITVTDFDVLQNGFTYSVHDFTNRSSTSSTIMSESGASVKVYCGNELVKTYYIPTGRGGTVWNVFSVDANGVIKDLNTFEYQSNAGSVGASFAGNAVNTLETYSTASPDKTYVN